MNKKIWQVENQQDFTTQLIKGLGYPTRTNEKGEIFIYVEKEKKEYKIGQVKVPAKQKKVHKIKNIITVSKSMKNN